MPGYRPTSSRFPFFYFAIALNFPPSTSSPAPLHSLAPCWMLEVGSWKCDYALRYGPLIANDARSKEGASVRKEPYGLVASGGVWRRRLGLATGDWGWLKLDSY
eukprot:scaffold57302_cov36-Tisochrysis_lutea.AAC.4